MDALMQRLVAEIAVQLRTLRERDGVAVTEDQVFEHARSIVTVLLGLYDVRAWAADDDWRRNDDRSWYVEAARQHVQYGR